MPRVCCLWPTSLPYFASIYVVIITDYVKTVVCVASYWSAPLCRFQMFFRDLALMLTYLFCFYKYKGLKGVFFLLLGHFWGSWGSKLSLICRSSSSLFTEYSPLFYKFFIPLWGEYCFIAWCTNISKFCL